MKLSPEKKEEVEELRSKAVRSAMIRTGDTLTISISHNVVINGDQAWVKFEASTVDGENETEWESFNRLNDYVNEGVMKTITTTVKTVNEATGEKQ